MEESTTAADGDGDGERLLTTVGDSVETPVAMVGAIESSEVGAGAIDVLLESRAQRPAASKEQAACLEMPRGMVDCFVWPLRPRERHQLWRKRMRSRRLSVKNHDLKPSTSSASEGTKLWSWRRRTPLGR